MLDAEAMLRRQKAAIDQLEVPSELEARLRNAVMNGREPVSRRLNWRLAAAAVVLVVSLLGYHADTLAYYGTKLLGYNQIMTGTLRELNELGKGQIVGRSYTFRTGMSITLDGIMLDGNQLLAFYTVKDPAGQVEAVNLSPFMTLKGLVGEYQPQGASGIINDANTEIKYIASFRPPYLFEKTLRLTFVLQDGSGREDGSIRFTLDRRQAMGYTLRQAINRTIEADGTKIRFETIAASPTTTVISGTIQTTLELAVDQLRGERMFPGNLEIELLADGKAVARQGAGMSTDLSGMTFEQEFDALPEGLQELTIRLVRFGADHAVGEQIALSKEGLPVTVTILGQSITVNAVREETDNTFVTITSEERVVLTKVRLLADDKEIGLEETSDSTLEKLPDGTILHTRTLRFPGTGEDLRLDIRRMKYAKEYDESIVIPVE